MRPNPAKESPLDRRSFLQRSIASGIVLGTASIASANTASDLTNVCSNASFIDALVFELSRISDLQSKIMMCFVDKLVAETNKCRDDYSALKTLIDELEVEICRSTKNTPNKKVSEVVELGQTSVKLVQTSYTQGDTSPYLIAAGAINQQLANKAGECLPDGPLTLSAKASQLLREIIAFVNTQSKVIASKLSDVQADHSTKARAVSDIFHTTSTHLATASKELIMGEISTTGPTAAAASLRRSYAEIGRAVLSMRSLLADPACASVVNTALPKSAFVALPARPLNVTADDIARAFLLPVSYLRNDPNNDGPVDPGKVELIDLISISLEGIRRGIVNRYGLNIAKSGASELSLRSVSYQPDAVAESNVRRYENVQGLLERHALAATPSRVANVTARAQGAIGWWNIFEFTKTIVIRNNLNGFWIEPRSDRTPPNYSPSIDGLARGLARIF